VPLPLAFEAAAAAAEIPEGCEAPVLPGAGTAPASLRGLPYCSMHSSVDGSGMGHLAADACIESWLQPGRAGVPSAGSGLASMGGASSLLSSDGEIMADPTAVQLFMELNEEIEAEGKAAMAASAAAKTAAAASSLSSAASAAAAAAAEPAAAAEAAAVSGPAAAVEVRSSADGAGAAGVSAGSRRTSSRGASGQLAGEASGSVQQPAGEASWGSGGAEDLRHSVSPESQGVQSTSNTGAEPAAAVVAAAEGPLPADELRVSNTVDTRPSASNEAPVALTSKAEGAPEGAEGSGAAAATVSAAAAPAHVPDGGLSQQASSQGGSDADAEVDAPDGQPSCGCKCVIM
jgi:hypothetical protein